MPCASAATAKLILKCCASSRILAPTIVNVGNSTTAISSIRKSSPPRLGSSGRRSSRTLPILRTGALYGVPSTQISVKGKMVRVSAIGTPALDTYRNGAAWYSAPSPGPYAASRFSEIMAGSDFHLVLVHAGFRADTAVLPSTDAPFLLHGGHDHLRLTQRLGTSGLHIHSGYWSNGLAAIGVSFIN